MAGSTSTASRSTTSSWNKLFDIEPEAWLAELDSTEEFFSRFGEKLPAALTSQLADIRRRVRLSIEN